MPCRLLARRPDGNMRFAPIACILTVAAFAETQPTPVVELKPVDGAVEVQFAGKTVAAYLTANDVSTPVRVLDGIRIKSSTADTFDTGSVDVFGRV